jgi:hypothetical protein
MSEALAKALARVCHRVHVDVLHRAAPYSRARELCAQLVLVLLRLREAYLVDCVVLARSQAQHALAIAYEELAELRLQPRAEAATLCVALWGNTFILSSECFERRMHALLSHDWTKHPLWVDVGASQPTACRVELEPVYTPLITRMWQSLRDHPHAAIDEHCYPELSPCFVFGWVLGYPCLYVLHLREEQHVNNCLAHQLLEVHRWEVCLRREADAQVYDLLQFTAPKQLASDGVMSEALTSIAEHFTEKSRALGVRITYSSTEGSFPALSL